METDRQTDTTIRSSQWSVTAFNKDIDILEDKANYPSWVKCVLGGREICPTTGTLHFQASVHLNKQVRMSQLKKWLPTAKLLPARKPQALDKYAMKKETADGEKSIRVNDMKFYRSHDILLLLAVKYNELIDTLPIDEMGDFWYFEYVMRRLLVDDITMINFVDNKLKCNWRDYHTVFIRHVRAPKPP